MDFPHAFSGTTYFATALASDQPFTTTYTYDRNETGVVEVCYNCSNCVCKTDGCAKIPVEVTIANLTLTPEKTPAATGFKTW